MAEAFKDAEDEETKTVVDLLVNQVEFADVILLNKTDMVSEQQLFKIEGILKTLSATAKVSQQIFSVESLCVSDSP